MTSLGVELTTRHLDALRLVMAELANFDAAHEALAMAYDDDDDGDEIRRCAENVDAAEGGYLLAVAEMETAAELLVEYARTVELSDGPKRWARRLRAAGIAAVDAQVHRGAALAAWTAARIACRDDADELAVDYGRAVHRQELATAELEALTAT